MTPIPYGSPYGIDAEAVDRLLIQGQFAASPADLYTAAMAVDTLPEAPTGPSGTNGDDAAVCSCGAPAHPKLPNRCSSGHVVRGNRLALVHGGRSLQTREQDIELAERVASAILADKGFDDPEAAPTALVIAVSTLARAAVAESRTFERVGDLAGDHRERRAQQVWFSLVDRVYAGLRLVGIAAVDVPPRELWR